MRTQKRGGAALGDARPTGNRGQAMIEYLVTTAAVSIVLFVPFDLTNHMSAADYLARAVRAFFRTYSFLLSVS